MTPEAFRAWRLGLGLTLQAVADALGMSLRQIQYYEAGREIPRTIELATEALEHRHQHGVSLFPRHSPHITKLQWR